MHNKIKLKNEMNYFGLSFQRSLFVVAWFHDFKSVLKQTIVCVEFMVNQSSFFSNHWEPEKGDI